MNAKDYFDKLITYFHDLDNHGNEWYKPYTEYVDNFALRYEFINSISNHPRKKELLLLLFMTILRKYNYNSKDVVSKEFTSWSRYLLNHNKTDMPVELAKSFELLLNFRIQYEGEEAIKNDLKYDIDFGLKSSIVAKSIFSKPTREINKEKLEQYFKAQFKGAGNNNINYFDEYLIPDIRKLTNDKDIFRLALVIWESDKMIKSQKPSKFVKWYRLFCDMIGANYNKSYKPSMFSKEMYSLKKKYNYL